jgi:two-component system, NtrC family, sensor kinase
MFTPRSISNLSFRTKMLVTVTAVMVLLLAISLGLVSQRFKVQIHNNAAEQLRTAEGILKIRQQTRAEELFLRFNSVKNEPRLKAAATSLLAEQKALLTLEGQKTFRGILDDVVKGGAADIVMLTPDPELGHSVAAARDPQFNVKKFEVQCADSIKFAFANQPKVDVVENNGRLFDIVTLPVTVSDDIVGTITFGVENSMAREFEQLMKKDDDLVLLLDGHVAASTLRDDNSTTLAPKQFSAMTAESHSAGDMQEIVLGDEHFWGLAGWLDGQDESHRLGYLILSSYEKPLQVLRSTQQTILSIGLLAILFGVAVVWFLIGKITEPLRALHDSAEAVGRGDFSKRVKIETQDEFGELAHAFNQMTGNIEQSQSQLKQTVETLKNTQAQLIQSEKLSAVGEFVAGVAHELNNPLAAVMGFSEMLRIADVGEKNRHYLDLVFKSAQRCQKIVQSLLSFARRQQPERRPVMANKLIEDVLEMVAYPLRTSNVKVITDLAEKLPPILADGHQIQQVVLNIINNARQAIEAHQGSGCITISTNGDSHLVRIVITDSGPGISPENLQRIFDPFFTTKEVGKGTGLGLSLCYGIIREHGGNIIPSSKPGEGATFTIELPVADHYARFEITADAMAGKKTDLNEGAGKKILAVDDEESLLHMMKEELGRHSYEVTTATNGETALRALREKQFDLIVCDLKMPGLNGRQVYERLREESPEKCRRMIFVTGDIISNQLRDFFEAENCPCLTKPFSLGDLRQTIRSTLAKL